MSAMDTEHAQQQARYAAHDAFKRGFAEGRRSGQEAMRKRCRAVAWRAGEEHALRDSALIHIDKAIAALPTED